MGGHQGGRDHPWGAMQWGQWKKSGSSSYALEDEMLVEYSDNKIEIIATFFLTWKLSALQHLGLLRGRMIPDSILLTLSSLHKANRNGPVKGYKKVETSLGAKPARAAALVIALLPCNSSELLASPIWRLPNKNVYLVVVWKQHFFLRYGAVSIPLWARGQEWDSHAHSSSGSKGQPQPGKALRWSHFQWEDWWTRGSSAGPLSSPRCALGTCRLAPHSLGWGDALEGKECFTLSKLLTVIL